MDKFRFYKGHRTSLDDLNEVQDFFEGSDHARTRDWLGTGVAFGMELTPSTGTMMTSQYDHHRIHWSTVGFQILVQ